MPEAFSQSANNNEAPKSHEEVEQLKAESIDKALDAISDLGLPDRVGDASLEELAMAIEELPALIQELSYNDAGEVANENRHIVKPLSIYLEKANRIKAANDIPEPFAA